MADSRVNYPSWTEYQKKGGLDPLGMQNSGVLLYQSFLPGISNVTLRVRYYGFFVWLVNAYLQDVGDTNPETWKRYVRRAEALYALIAQRRGGEGGIAGIQWAGRELAKAGIQQVDFCAAAEPGSEAPYLKQTWGVFGQAYRSQLFEIGLLTRAEGDDIPRPSLEIGDAIVADFERALGDRTALFREAIDRGVVTLAELDRLAAFAPSEIELSGTERALYERILLAEGSEPKSSDRSRRLSIQLVLSVSRLLARVPDIDEVRWTLYAGADAGGRALELDTQELEAHRASWRIYQANDLCHIALETLLKYALDTLALYPSGLPLPRLIALLVDDLMEEGCELPSSWDSLVAATPLAINPYDPAEMHGEWSTTQQIMRSVGKIETSQIGADTAWRAVKLLATLHRRARDEVWALKETFGHLDSELFRSIWSETQFLDRKADQDLRKTLTDLIEQRVIRRHLWVALRKFRYQKDYTFLIETDDGKLRCRDKDGPVYTNPRLGPTITFLKDLHIIGGQGLTDYGAALLVSA